MLDMKYNILISNYIKMQWKNLLKYNSIFSGQK